MMSSVKSAHQETWFRGQNYCMMDGIKFPSVYVYKDVHERWRNSMCRWDVKFFPQGSHYRYMKIFQILGNIRYLRHFWVPRCFGHDIYTSTREMIETPSQVFDLKLNPSLASSQDPGALPRGTEASKCPVGWASWCWLTPWKPWNPYFTWCPWTDSWRNRRQA